MDHSVRIKQLIDYLNDATKAYDEGKPYISDIEWDDKYFQLQELERETGIIYPNSPTQTIEYRIVNGLTKATHNHKMLSLDKTKSPEEVAAFMGSQPYVAMCKMDGLTCSLLYRGGVLVSAETRGNGEIGEDVLHNAMVIKSIPKQIPYLEELIIDGEIICTYDDFERFKQEYKNPRNFAAGSIRLLDANECGRRNLTFVAWDIITQLTNEDGSEKTVSEKLDFAQRELGFTVVPYLLNHSNTIVTLIQEIQQCAEYKSYPIDGVVFKFDNCAYGRVQGETGHHFKNAIAYKFRDETYPTTLIDLEWSMGRTGVLTPVAVFEPVEIEGSIVERASLHNVFIVNEIFGPLGPYRDQEIEVYRANMIIPQVYSANQKKVSEDRYIECIKTCPVCGQPLMRRFSENSIFMVCENKECDGKLINKLDHFCGKKGLDIKGLSKATLEKLIDWGWLNESFNLFTLSEHRDEWVQKPGFGPKSVDKILKTIDAATKNCSLANFITALGIPLIGERASKVLVNVFPTWDDFIEAVNDPNYSFEDLDGFGYEMNKSLKEHDYAEAIYSIQCGYIVFAAGASSPANMINDLEGKTFVITGKVHIFKNRDELKDYIELRGGKVTGSVSRNTNYLINNDYDSDSAKNKSAKSLNIPIITEEKFLSLFGEMS